MKENTIIAHYHNSLDSKPYAIEIQDKIENPVFLEIEFREGQYFISLDIISKSVKRVLD